MRLTSWAITLFFPLTWSSLLTSYVLVSTCLIPVATPPFLYLNRTDISASFHQFITLGLSLPFDLFLTLFHFWSSLWKCQIRGSELHGVELDWSLNNHQAAQYKLQLLLVHPERTPSQSSSGYRNSRRSSPCESGKTCKWGGNYGEWSNLEL